MSGKKRTSKKKGASGSLVHTPSPAGPAGRKGSRRRFKGHGPRRGIGRSMALARRARRQKQELAAAKAGKRRRRARNASASAAGLHEAAKRAEKAAFDQTVAAADSGGAAKPGKKRRTKKKTAGKKRVSRKKTRASKKATARKKTRTTKGAAAAAARASKKVGKKKMSKVAARRRYRQGRAKTPKFKLMHKWGLPRRGKVAAPKRLQLRKAAGYGKITYDQIMNTIQAEKLKGWVCVGPKRTGCGGGSKNLRGGHQIGVYATGHR